MKQQIITPEHISAYLRYLEAEERAPGTLEKYRRDIRAFCAWNQGAEVTRDRVLAWKQHLCHAGRCASTVNGMLSALHGFFEFHGWSQCRVRFLKVQRRVFQDPSRALSKEEYLRLVRTAQSQGRQRLALLVQTICATGVRVSEVSSITVEAARRGSADIALKGKIRRILIPGSLARQLLKYAQKQKITSGEIFLTASGKGLSRGQIWVEMKRLCQSSNVDAGKVFPHNLRHLFARVFYAACRDIVRLADVLGHSSIETTRIYLISTGEEHARSLEQLGLIL